MPNHNLIVCLPSNWMYSHLNVASLRRLDPWKVELVYIVIYRSINKKRGVVQHIYLIIFFPNTKPTKRVSNKPNQSKPTTTQLL